MTASAVRLRGVAGKPGAVVGPSRMTERSPENGRWTVERRLETARDASRGIAHQAAAAAVAELVEGVDLGVGGELAKVGGLPPA